jgi:DNA-binding NarL/FixJ family response regulator
MDAATVHRVFVVGDSLFAESVAELLGHSPALVVVGVAATVAAALAHLDDSQPDLVIVLSSGTGSGTDHGPLLSRYPDLPILRADLNVNDLRIFRSQRVEARLADLMAAIQALPTRR